MVWQGRVRQGKARLIQEWQGSARLGMARPGKARLILVWSGELWCGEAGRGPARYGRSRLGKVDLGPAWLGVVSHGVTRQGRSWYGEAGCWSGKARRAAVWRVKARRGFFLTPNHHERLQSSRDAAIISLRRRGVKMMLGAMNDGCRYGYQHLSAIYAPERGE